MLGHFGANLGQCLGHLGAQTSQTLLLETLSGLSLAYSDEKKRFSEISTAPRRERIFESQGGHLGTILGQPWAILGQLEGIIGDVGVVSGLSCILKPSWGHLRAILEPT